SRCPWVGSLEFEGNVCSGRRSHYDRRCLRPAPCPVRWVRAARPGRCHTEYDSSMQTQPEVREVVWTGRSGPFKLLVDDRVFAPTHTSREVAEGMVVEPGDTVIDVGCGT